MASRALREQRAEKLEAFDKFADIVAGKDGVAGRALSDEEKQQRSALKIEIESLGEQIEILEEREQRQAALAIAGGNKVGSEGEQREQQAQIKRYNFLGAVRAKLNQEPLTGLEREMHQEAEKEARESGLRLKRFGPVF